MATATEPIEQVKERVDLLPLERVREEIDAGEAELIDVREQHEWDEAHLEAATHVPQGDLLDRIEELVPERSRRVLLYCRTDNRSSRAADALHGLGYANVAVLRGGIVGWQEAGLPVEAPAGLDAEQRMRYSRHTLLPEIGVEGQLKLLDSKVLLIGAGGLGAPAAVYLAAAGVGTLGIVDFDTVDVSNLQRQILHGTKDVGRPKVDSAIDRIHDMNPDIQVIGHREPITSANALDVISGYDVRVHGADNFPPRQPLNHA